MQRKLLNTLTFILAIAACLCTVGVAAAFLIFSSNSGWQGGFAILFALQGLVLAVGAGLAFALSNVLFHNRITPARAAMLGVGSFIAALAASTAVYFLGLSGIASISSFYLGLVIAGFCLPIAFRVDDGQPPEQAP